MVETEIVRRWKPFSHLPPGACERIAEEARLLDLDKGERLHTPLRPATLLYLVDSGLAKLVGVTEGGGERIIYAFKAGDLIGSHVFLEGSHEMAYDIAVMAPGRFLQIRKETLVAVNREHPDVMFEIVKLFATRVELLHGRILAAMSEEVVVRLSRLLLDFVEEDAGRQAYASLSYDLTHRTIAQMVGASRPHVSTLLKDLERAGAVRRIDRRLHVRRDRLQEVLSDAGVAPAHGALQARWPEN